ncbi:V-type ATP synthase subunit F [Ruminococcaceae bacterium OttesenSCG-928-A16]|nr:V-type ATP synthase subunit F [Ruminococcaceae bacterium OttesenSCG-928-A16]
MKYFLISDNTDTLAAMRMVGITGVVVHQEAEVKAALEEAVQDPEVGLVLITSKLYTQFQTLVFHYKLHRAKPLIVEMPDRHSNDNVADDIKRYIYEVVGIKI